MPGRQTGQRHQREGQRPPGQRLVADQPAVVGEPLRRAAAADHRRRPRTRRGSSPRRSPGSRSRHRQRRPTRRLAAPKRHQDVAGLSHRRPGQQPDRVLLAQREQVADRHGQRREHRRATGAQTSAVGSANPGSTSISPTKPAAFDTTDRYAATGDRRADVGVRHPHVERHGRHLERQPDDRQQGADQRPPRRDGRRQDERGAIRSQEHRPGRAVQQATRPSASPRWRPPRPGRTSAPPRPPARSPRRSPAIANAGSDTTSSATTSVTRSREAAIVSAPVAEQSSRKFHSPSRRAALGDRDGPDQRDHDGAEQHDAPRTPA